MSCFRAYEEAVVEGGGYLDNLEAAADLCACIWHKFSTGPKPSLLEAITATLMVDQQIGDRIRDQLGMKAEALRK
jgi:hypothetical protein